MSFRRNASQCIYFGLTSTTGALDQTGNFSLNRSRDNDSQASCTGALANKGNGQFALISSSDDLNGVACGFFFTAPGCAPLNLTIRTTAANPDDSVRLGLTGLANAVPGAAGGLLIAGSNAPTIIQQITIPGGITGNLSGSVGSVTGAVGSVTGAVGSVTGAVGSVTGNVSGSVGSVAGNVNGNVLGSVQGNIGGTLAVVGVGAIGATSFTAASMNALADAYLDRNMATGADSGSESVRTVRQSLRFNRNKVDATTGEVFKEDDATVSWTFALTRAAGNPVTIIDPTGP